MADSKTQFSGPGWGFKQELLSTPPIPEGAPIRLYTEGKRAMDRPKKPPSVIGPSGKLSIREHILLWSVVIAFFGLVAIGVLCNG